jgi:hypothetical protein
MLRWANNANVSMMKLYATVHIMPFGRVDLSGTDPFNMSFSHRRPDAVRMPSSPTAFRPIASSCATLATDAKVAQLRRFRGSWNRCSVPMWE